MVFAKRRQSAANSLYVFASNMLFLGTPSFDQTSDMELGSRGNIFVKPMTRELMTALNVTDRIGGFSRMATVEEYLRYAAECVALAQKAELPEERARLLQMAQAWRDLADRLSNNEAKR
jgi:hypothetical protein